MSSMGPTALTAIHTLTSLSYSKIYGIQLTGVNMEQLLDYSTAIEFLERIGLADPEKLLKENPLSFLESFVRGYQEHMPFQCVSILAQSTEEKHVPTLQEVVEAGLSLEGGLCLTLNTFACILLRVLRFKAELVDGCYSALGNTHNHVLILVKDLRHDGDDYIIDVGNGFPFEDPIAVNELPGARHCAGLEYKYQWQDDVGGFILRLHRVGDDVPEWENAVMREGWRQVFHFNLKPVTFDYFHPYMEGIYVEEGGSDFHTTLRAVRFPSSGKNERTMLAFKNQSFLTGPMDKAQKTRIGYEELSCKIKENFPTIPQSKIDLGVKNWLKITEVKST
ncbi:uncharacterized protein [Macrobrachium rosenbergii]|uniref:uncharacterized protein isoform X2 n=1 Tax=Macrobrachium rosenbergii TaxID=79674 RepID=UPI0034D5D96B